MYRVPSTYRPILLVRTIGRTGTSIRVVPIMHVARPVLVYAVRSTLTCGLWPAGQAFSTLRLCAVKTSQKVCTRVLARTIDAPASPQG